MRILHISFSDNGGGAAIAAYRHHEALHRAGFDSKMLVQSKLSSDPNVIEHKISGPKRFMKRVLGKLFALTHQYYATWSWNHYGFDLADDDEVKDADVIILHWINSYTISLRSLEKILKTGKTVYWFMHDMWPLTGGCNHSLNCNLYASHCSECPMTNNLRGTHKVKDLSWKQFEEKARRLKPYNNLRFLTPSQWLAERVKESALFSHHEVKVVRNVLDTDVFSPRDKKEARHRLGLPQEKKLILFGADNISSPYKGWSLLREAITEPIEGAEAVVYGKAPSSIQNQIGIHLHQMGRINDIDTLVDLYNACDVFVTTSIAENYPNVLLEALACGLPCVGTKVGGIPEIIHEPFCRVVPIDSSKAIRDSIINVINRSDLIPSSDVLAEIDRNNSYHSSKLISIE